MRCGSVEPLVERFVDGDLDAATAREVETHARACRRCAARVAAARRLLAAFDAEPLARAPEGFTDAVMDAVYREALAPRDATRAGAARSLPVLRMYRRVGLSFVVTGAVLAMSLLIPRFSYSVLLSEQGIGAGFGKEGAVIAQGTLENAGQAMRGLMGGKDGGGGTTR
jgi:anti-sigma factor RsiW